MKKNYFALLVAILIAGNSLLAATAPASPSARWFKLEQDFQQLTITGNVRIILVQSEDDRIEWMGNAKLVEKIIVSNTSKGLFVDAPASVGAEDVTVIIPIKKLQSLVVNGDATISSRSNLEVPGLTICINGKPNISIANKGAILIKGAQANELVVEKVFGKIDFEDR